MLRFEIKVQVKVSQVIREIHSRAGMKVSASQAPGDPPLVPQFLHEVSKVMAGVGLT